MGARLRFVAAAAAAASLFAVGAPAAEAQTCNALTRLLGCKAAPAPSAAPTTAPATSCSVISQLLGCKPTGTSSTPTTSTTVTCTPLQALLGCKPSGGKAPPQPGVRPDGSLDVGTVPLQPLPDHDPRAVPAAPLWPRVSGHLPYGFNGWRAGMPLAAMARLGSGAGAHVARVAMHWPAIEYRRSTWGWATFDALYAEHVKRGVRPLWVLMNTPRAYVDGRNATPSVCGGTILAVGWDCRAPVAMSRLGHLEDFARRVAVRYPLSAGIEVWNEPNLKRYWRPGPDPARYATVVRAVWNGVHRPAQPDGTGGRPEMRILAGATNNVATSKPDAMADSTFLHFALDAGLGETVDGLSFHVFPHDLQSGMWAASFNRIETELASRPEPHVASMRLALTETGLSTGVPTDVSKRHTPREQADGLVSLYKQLDAGTPGGGKVDLFVVHTLEDYASQGHEEGFGTLRARLASGKWPAKLSWCALRREAGGIIGAVPTEVLLDAAATQECGVTGALQARRIRR